MLKNLLIWALLTPTVFCRTANLFDRQWEEGDTRQICTETCTTECKNCSAIQEETPYVCDPETEIMCDCIDPTHATYEWIVNCPCSEVCVPKDCQCPSDENCPLICEVECEDDELKCPGGTSGECKENDYCHPKGTNNNGDPCPGYCPFDCDDDEKRCPVPDDPITGCPTPPLCIPLAKDSNGEEREDQHCPVYCEPEVQDWCQGEVDHMGCQAADQCVTECTETCPVTCQDDEIKCEVENCGDCVDPPVCKPKAKDVNGDSCPNDSASHGCPITCCGDTVLCPEEPDVLGCSKPRECAPTSTGMDNATCPWHSDCPTVCEPAQVKCPNDNTDDHGCKLPDYCLDQDRDHDGELCTVHCPVECNDDETYCPGQRNEEGCLEPDTCVKRPIKTTGSDKGGLCPGWCPPLCRHDQIKCPSQVDPCDGCPTEEVCVDAASDINDIFCPVDPLSYSHGCTVLCDDLHGEVLCSPKLNKNGCKDAAVCKERPVDNDGQYCPAHSVCDANCEEDEIECNYGIDARGCKEATLCRKKGTNLDNEPCPGVCPPTCSGAQILTSGGQDETGCELAPTCQTIE